jgi:hypothetical protein
MEYAHTDVKPVNWTAPATVKTAPAFVVRNHVHFGDIEPSPTNDLYPGWYIGGGSVKNTAQTIDKVSGKVATSCTPAAAKENVTNANTASWNIDIFNGGHQSIGSSTTSTTNTPTATDDVHNCNDSPPTVTLTAPIPPTICLVSCTITATVTQGTHALSDPQHAQYPGQIVFALDGQTINTQALNDSPTTVTFTYNPTSIGSGTLTATVTDSVLYSGTQSAPLSYSNAPSGQSQSGQGTPPQ